MGHIHVVMVSANAAVHTRDHALKILYICVRDHARYLSRYKTTIFTRLKLLKRQLGVYLRKQAVFTIPLNFANFTLDSTRSRFVLLSHEVLCQALAHFPTSFTLTAMIVILYVVFNCPDASTSCAFDTVAFDLRLQARIF